MPATDRTGLLKAFLGGLPGHVAARLAVAVEVDRLMEGRGLPHDDILNGLRPVLRRDHYDRTLTPLRLFCHPFQDLLNCAPRLAKQKGSIARGSLVPVWNWVSQTLIPGEAERYSKECKALVLAQKNDDAMARASLFWPLASVAMTAALKEPNTRKILQKTLGHPLAVDDADEMALLLAAGGIIEKLSALLPKPVPSFNETLLWDVRNVYDALIETLPDVAPYVAVIAMNRLARPWEALRLPMMVARKHDETLIAKTDMGLVGEILFDRMDALKNSIQKTRHPLFDAEMLMEEVRTFADLSSHIVKEIELKREGEWGKRLLAERVQIGKVMEGFMDRAHKEFNAALPMSRGTGADFSRHPGAEKHMMAKRYARLVAGSRNFAAAASFTAKQIATYEDLCTTLKRYNEDVIKALKGHPANPEVVNAQFELCAELTALLFSEEEAERLRRRGKAAQAAAA
jgi:hypothetical protein